MNTVSFNVSHFPAEQLVVVRPIGDIDIDTGEPVKP